MIKKILLLVFMSFILFSCIKAGKEKSNIKFKKWNEAVIVKDSKVIAENSIAGFKKGVFRTNYDIDSLKKAYEEQGYEENPDKENQLIKDNIKIELIYVDDKNVNILIDIKPKEK